jgi:hypothetical protein
LYQIPSIKAILGGYDKARIIKPDIDAGEAYKSDIHEAGNLLKQILNPDNSEEFQQVSTGI